jgi:beta-lactamase regulating signal transducer with metallopeptidase domain
MSDAGRILSTLALNAAWQVPAVVAAALLADLLLRRAPARTRHAIWRIALVLAVCLPVLASVPRSPAGSRGATALPGVPVVGAAPAATGEGGGGARRTIPVSGLAGLAGLAVVVVSASSRLSRLLLALRRAYCFRSAAVEETSSRVKTLARGCEEALGLGRVPVLSAPGLAGPVTLGLLRPVVLLPPTFAAAQPDDEVRATLAHELAHVKRRDFASNLAHEAALVPFSWHPVVRLLRRRLDETREMACDELACERLLEPRRYAKSLLAVASAVSGPAPAPGLGVNDGDILEERIRHLLRPRGGTAGRTRLAVAAGVALLLATSLFASWAVVEAKPLPAGSPAEWRSQMKHAALAVVLALGLTANGDDLAKGLEALEAGDLKVAAASVEKAVAANPKDRDALYTLGVIRWQSTYNALQQTKKSGGLEPAARDALRKDVASGHDALGKAIAIDPRSFEAHAYDNLLYRLDADLATDPGEAKAYLAKAEDRLAKAKQLRAAGGSDPAPKVGAAQPPPAPGTKTALPPLPPPPPPARSAKTLPPPPAPAS